MILRRPDEAMQQIERAVAIAPLDGRVRLFHAMCLNFARRYDEAPA
jgi:Flp pilus assembly protein TadD